MPRCNKDIASEKAELKLYEARVNESLAGIKPRIKPEVIKYSKELLPPIIDEIISHSRHELIECGGCYIDTDDFFNHYDFPCVINEPEEYTDLMLLFAALEIPELDPSELVSRVFPTKYKSANKCNDEIIYKFVEIHNSDPLEPIKTIKVLADKGVLSKSVKKTIEKHYHKLLIPVYVFNLTQQHSLLDTEYSRLMKKNGELKKFNRKDKQLKSEAETGVTRLKFETEIKRRVHEIELLEGEIENLKVKKRSSLDKISECCHIANFLSGDKREKLKSDTEKRYARNSEARPVAVNKRPRVPSDAIVHLKSLYVSMFNHIKERTPNPEHEDVIKACVRFISGEYYVTDPLKSEMTTNLNDFKHKCDVHECEIRNNTFNKCFNLVSKAYHKTLNI